MQLINTSYISFLTYLDSFEIQYNPEVFFFETLCCSTSLVTGEKKSIEKDITESTRRHRDEFATRVITIHGSRVSMANRVHTVHTE